MSTGRNDPCPCGSGKKYKHCCMGRDQAAEQVQHRFGLAPIAAADQPARGVWQVDLTPLAIRIEADAAARPAATLVVENRVVLDVDLESAPPSDAEAIAAELERVIARTANRTGGWPHRVEVRDAEVAGQLSRLLASREVEVIHRTRLDALDAVAADLREHLAGAARAMPPASSPETWRGWGLPRDIIAELFRAAAEFWRRHHGAGCRATIHFLLWRAPRAPGRAWCSATEARSSGWGSTPRRRTFSGCSRTRRPSPT